jgi:hypothetical protein
MAVHVRREPTFAPLEYRLALDLAFAASPRAVDNGSSLLLMTSAPLLIQEVCMRAVGPVTIVADTPAALASARRLACTPEFQRPLALRVADPEEPANWTAESHAAVIWASPRRATWRQIVTYVDAATAPGAMLAALVAGPLMRPLARLLTDRPLGGPGWSAQALTRDLVRRGYRAEMRYTLGGTKSIWWTVASRLAAVMSRHDLVDRAEAGYRAAISDVSPASLVRLELAVFRKGAISQ